MKNAKSGFTLVEIMIVVMIIGLLAAIALPSFQRARTTAQKNACIENLRQINGAVQQYLIEERQNTVPALSAVTVYFQTGVLPICPAASTDYAAPATPEDLPTCTSGIATHTLSPQP